MPKASPFSLSHDWSLGWTRIPSNYKPFKYYNINSMKEKKALEGIASVGVIGEKQLSRLFSLGAKEIKNMVKTDKIVPHALNRNHNNRIPIYSLGINGAKAINLDVYKENYWVEYKIDEVLKSLLFFQLYHYFPTLNVRPTPNPFVAAVKNNDNLIYVYVVKGDTNDLMRYLKWEKNSNHRLMLVTESISQLKEIELYTKDLKMRVVIEDDLMNREKSDEDIFYIYKDGELV